MQRNEIKAFSLIKVKKNQVDIVMLQLQLCGYNYNVCQFLGNSIKRTKYYFKDDFCGTDISCALSDYNNLSE